MLENIHTFGQMVLADWQNFLLGGIVIVSAIIVAIGMLKPLITNNVSNKHVKNAIFAGLDVIFAFAATALQFWVTSMPFKHYVVASIAHLILTVFVYWIYENTSLRDAIHKIGSFALSRTSNVIFKNVTASNSLDTLKKELSRETLPELKEKAHKEIGSADFTAFAYKPDTDLKNL